MERQAYIRFMMTVEWRPKYVEILLLTFMQYLVSFG
jgi:hypothetical protein